MADDAYPFDAEPPEPPDDGLPPDDDPFGDPLGDPADPGAEDGPDAEVIDIGVRRIPGVLLSETKAADLYVHHDEAEVEPDLPALLASALRTDPVTVPDTHHMVGGAIADALDGRLRIDPAGQWWLWAGTNWIRVTPAQVSAFIAGMIGRDNGRGGAVRSIIPYRGRKFTNELLGQLEAARAGVYNASTGEFRTSDGRTLSAWPFPSDDWAESQDCISRVRSYLAGQDGVAMNSAFDTAPHYINAQGTVIELVAPEYQGDWFRTGPINRKVLISKTLGTHYDPEATAPQWATFLREITSYRDPVTKQVVEQLDLVRFLQVLVGLTLLGEVREQIIVVLHGATGSNGKSVFANILVRLFGEYAATLPKAVLMEKRGDAHTTDLTLLIGSRMGYTKETKRGRWDEETAKDLASSEPMTARKMRQDNVSWEPTHTLWTTTNNTPLVSAAEQAFWRRILIVPFKQRWFADNDTEAMKSVSIAPIDPDLPAKLETELPGILNWALEGLMLYFEDGKLYVPDVVKAATEAARRGGSLWAEFTATHILCTEDPADIIAVGDLWELWKKFREEWSQHESAPGSQPALIEALLAEYPAVQVADGADLGKRKGTKFFVGLDFTPLGAELATAHAKAKKGGFR